MENRLKALNVSKKEMPLLRGGADGLTSFF
jgi:hypothetical protein